MDLAMPGIDGWETLRRMQVRGWQVAATAIVSANAFDKALDNGRGHHAAELPGQTGARE